jgi:hypothetical protein
VLARPRVTGEPSQLGGRTLRLAVRIRLSSADLLDELLEFLRAEPGAVVEQLSDDEVEVSLLGSYQQDALRMQLYLRLRAWEAAHRASGVRVEIIG